MNNNNARINRYFKAQEGQTCWYYSMMNGFMISKRCHKVMHFITQKFITTNIKTRAEFENFQNPDECSKRDTLYSFCKSIFISDTFDITGIQSIYKNINNTTINSGYSVLSRLSKFMVVSGIDPHVNWIDDENKTYVESSESRLFSLVTNFASNRINNHKTRDTLEFAIFSLQYSGINIPRVDTTPHGILGVRLGQKYWIIDSNGFKGEIDWRIPSNILKSAKYMNWCQKNYGFTYSSAEPTVVVYASKNCDKLVSVQSYKFNFKNQNNASRRPMLRARRPTKNTAPK